MVQKVTTEYQNITAESSHAKAPIVSNDISSDGIGRKSPSDSKTFGKERPVVQKVTSEYQNVTAKASHAKAYIVANDISSDGIGRKSPSDSKTFCKERPVLQKVTAEYKKVTAKSYHAKAHIISDDSSADEDRQWHLDFDKQVLADLLQEATRQAKSKIFADKHAARAAEMGALGVWSDDDEDDVGDG